MPWYAVVDRITGEPVSYGTVVASPLPRSLMAREITHQPDEGERYDVATGIIVPRVPTVEELDAAITVVDAQRAELYVEQQRLETAKTALVIRG